MTNLDADPVTERARALNIPEAALRSAVDGAAMLDGRAVFPSRVNLIAHAVAALKHDDFLAEQPVTDPEPGGEFRGLAHVVDVWRAGDRVQRASIGVNFPAMADILCRADTYMYEVEAQQPVNEAAPTADDRHPTVAALDELLHDLPRGLSELYGPGDWLNLAVHCAAEATCETAPEWVDAHANVSRMFSHLAEATCTVEQYKGARRDA